MPKKRRIAMRPCSWIGHRDFDIEQNYSNKMLSKAAFERSLISSGTFTTVGGAM